MMRKILSLHLLWSVKNRSSKSALLTSDTYQSHQATHPCPLHSSDTGPLSFPGNEQVPSPGYCICCLFYLGHFFIHSFISLKKYLLSIKYVTGPGDMLINEIRPFHTHGACILVLLLPLSSKLTPTFPSYLSSISSSSVKFFQTS